MSTNIIAIALLIVLCAILFALTQLKYSLRKKNNPNYDPSTRTYMTEGIILGVLVGGILGLLIRKEQVHLFIIPSMMIGLVLGAMVKGK